MIRKFFVYCKSDGVGAAFDYAIATVLSFLYRRSTTNFYRCDVGITTTPPLAADQFAVRECNMAELEQLNFPRLKMLAWRKWLSEGSRCYVGFHNGIPVSYTWTHFGEYSIHGIGRFRLAEDECWIGPTFVRKDCRGKGYNKKQIECQMAVENKVCYTSVNARNMPSIRSFARLGYECVGSVVVKNLFGHKHISYSETMKILNKI